MVLRIIVLVLLLAPVVFGLTVSPGFTPDSLWYGFDRAWEEVRLAFTFDSHSKALFELELSRERLAEAYAMKIQNKSFEQLIKESDERVSHVVTVASEEEARGNNILRQSILDFQVFSDSLKLKIPVNPVQEVKLVKEINFKNNSKEDVVKNETRPIAAEPVVVVNPPVVNNVSVIEKPKIDAGEEYKKIGGAGLPEWKRQPGRTRSETDRNITVVLRESYRYYGER